MGKRFNLVGLTNWYLCNIGNFDSLSCYGIKGIGIFLCLNYIILIELVSSFIKEIEISV